MEKIEELRARKRELLARKKYELDLQTRGEGDRLALFMVQEELLDVSDQLRALTSGRRHSGGRTPADWAKDRQQYLSWRQADTALDEEIDRGRARMGQAAVKGLDRLSARQRELLAMHLEGQSGKEIAAALGVNKSTVSRTLARAKKALRQETERAAAGTRLRENSDRVDLRDPSAAGTVLLALTPKQTVYFYLYYSERLTLRAIEELTGTHHSAVFRTLRRALRNIGQLLGTEAETVLEHPEALDELAWQAYCQLEEHPELVPEGVQVPIPAPVRCRSPEQQSRKETPVPAAVSVFVKRRAKRNTPPGRLLAALLERRRERAGFPVLRWLETIFSTLSRRLRKHRKGGSVIWTTNAY